MNASDSPSREPYVVLLVDDEENILSSLKRVLRKEGYRILTATSGEAAMALLAENPKGISAVISDFRMPGMDGVEFLTRVRTSYPDTVRIILSGYVDADVVRAAINEGQVYKFVSKPWDDEDLKSAIRSSIQRHEAARIAQRVLTRVSTLRREMRRIEGDLGRPPSEAEVAARTDACGCPEDDCVAMGAARAWQQILNSVPVALLGVDREELVVFANPTAERAFGLNRLALLGTPIRDVLPPELCDLVRPVARCACESRSAILGSVDQPMRIECVPLQGTADSQQRGVLLCGFATNRSDSRPFEGDRGDRN